MAQNLQRKGIFSKKIKAFPWLAAFCWGLVMLLFEDDKGCLQASLSQSMVFLYKDSDVPLTSWK
jgi:peroxisomal membrane protein 4